MKFGLYWWVFLGVVCIQTSYAAEDSADGYSATGRQAYQTQRQVVEGNRNRSEFRKRYPLTEEGQRGLEKLRQCYAQLNEATYRHVGEIIIDFKMPNGEYRRNLHGEIARNSKRIEKPFSFGLTTYEEVYSMVMNGVEDDAKIAGEEYISLENATDIKAYLRQFEILPAGEKRVALSGSSAPSSSRS
jgi:hypothetical protein